ncbi:hypothetical protein CNR22_14195 [Sphingobacteriaceae bacterium]|nr:hypothetical protein CNR22_14195 [Sphingobacteriaceae bacterium]
MFFNRHEIIRLQSMIAINYIVAVLFTIFWAVGFFTSMVGPVVHILLLAAFALILINILHNDINPKRKNNHLIN